MQPRINKTYNWDSINWVEVQRFVDDIQRKIYRATKEQRFKEVKNLQKLLVRSWRGRLLAVRKVTTENKGKKTAGIDKIANLSKKERLTLAENLQLKEVKTKPVKRIYIPKSNGKLRPLGIPTMEERAKQALVKLALEPEWEAKFEPNSYGFRVGRNCHDAIRTIRDSCSYERKYVLDADITGCFDNIKHDKLLEKIEGSTTIKRNIKSWLKAGYVEWVSNKQIFNSTERGTPQGGVISPLLANIALDGLITYIKEKSYEEGYRVRKLMKGRKNPTPVSKEATLASICVVRYADDFVVICPDEQRIVRIKEMCHEWLGEIGLELNPEKTRIVTTDEGFNFLGHHFKLHKTGQYRSAKVKGKTNVRTGNVLLVKPTKEAIEKHLKTLRETIKTFIALPQEALIGKLNPIIRGWCNYYKYCNSKETFKDVWHRTYKRLWNWARRRHPKKGLKWVYGKYFNRQQQGKHSIILFGNEQIGWLTRHDSYESGKTYIKVKGDKSPYDGDLQYWMKRMKNYSGLTSTKSELLRKQNAICPICEEMFTYNDLNNVELDHISPKALGGNNEINNLQLVHKVCHIQKTKQDKKDIQTAKSI